MASIVCSQQKVKAEFVLQKSRHRPQFSVINMASTSDANVEILTCPFCDYKQDNGYQMLLHVEILHTEDGESPFAIKDGLEAARQSSTPVKAATAKNPASSDITDVKFIQCPYHCGEQVPADDLQFHTDFHLAEDMANHDTAVIDTTSSFSTDISTALRNHDHVISEVQTPIKQNQLLRTLKDMFSAPRIHLTSPVRPRTDVGVVRRLGTAELGPYANEKRMPNSLIKLLETDAKTTVTNRLGQDGKLIKVEIISNETPNLIPVLARLSFLDNNISRAFYCNPFVRHVSKLEKEGGFCGYRNIQMLISYIRDSQAPGHEHFRRKRLPTILKLQEMIEDAWDQGFNTSGLTETGGIRLTRKYIGTPEAQALLLSLGIPAEAVAFTAKSKEDVYMSMIQAVCAHFDDGSEANNPQKVFITDKPPLFFQHQGHSMTVVGVELDKQYRANLVVFDPMYKPAKQLRELALTNTLHFRTATPDKLLRAHRRDEKYLGRYKAFEMIKIDESE